MKRRPEDPKQLLIEWNRPADATLTLPAQAAPRPEVRSPLVQRLPWDFKTTFPQPTYEALDAGVIDASDTKFENLKSLHDNYAEQCLAILAAIDKVMDARRRGVDPGTQAKPRTHAARERLSKYLDEEAGRLNHTFRVLLDTYREAFGVVASNAFEKAIRAWHAGVAVEAGTEGRPRQRPKDGQSQHVKRQRVSSSLPVPKPLPQAIAEARFGQTGAGPVRPSAAEVREITEAHADKIIAQLREDSHADVAPLIRMYSEDFGEEAAQRLDRYCRREIKRSR